MPVDDTFGAFLRNYKPSHDTNSFLDKYLIQEGFKLEGINNPTKKGKEVYIEALDRHFSRLKSFLDSDKESIVNLVFGNVQSGKTSHLLANICWARDKNFHLAIVLTGSISDLGEQTVDRLREKLPENTAFIINSPTDSSLNATILNLLIDKVQKRENSTTVPIPVITLIKSPARLAAVKRMLQELKHNLNLNLKVILLDDEADQASVDATNSSRANTNSEVNLNSDHRIRTTIHSRINEIRDEVNGHLIYLAYTATPQALILGNFNGPLQPEYCSVVPVGEDYTSIGDIVRQYNALIKLDSTAHLDKDESNLIAMEKCLSQFLILSWLHKRHPNIFHSKTLDSNYKCEEKSVQFLIHPSGLNDEHQIFKDSMDDCLKDFQKYMESEKDQHEFLNQFFKPAYLIVLSKYSSNIKSFLEQDSEKLDCWNYVKNLINSTDKLKVKLVNDRERSNLRSQSNPEPLVPVSPSQWEKADAWVLIGGNILGRGLTIPHLVITLFLRNPRNPNFDTSVQQMRFCGYRKSYLPAIQVFAPEDIVEDYYDAVLIDEPFRARALKWDKSSRNLLKEPPISRFIAPSNTRFRPTRNSVLSGEIAVRDSIGQSGFFKLAKIANPLDFVNNMNIIIDLIKDKSIYEKYSNAETVSKIYLLSELDIRYLFLNWQINKLEMPDFMTMFELLGYDEKERGLSHLECLISIDEKIQKFPSGEEAHQNFNLFEVPERTINSKISEFDWKNFNNLEKLNSVEIKQVVGDSERKMRNDFSDKVFLQCRLYKLLNPSDVRLGIGSRNPIGRGVGLGISMIGWIPNTQEEFYINQEVGRNFVQ